MEASRIGQSAIKNLFACFTPLGALREMFIFVPYTNIGLFQMVEILKVLIYLLIKKVQFEH